MNNACKSSHSYFRRATPHKNRPRKALTYLPTSFSRKKLGGGQAAHQGRDAQRIAAKALEATRLMHWSLNRRFRPSREYR